MIPQPLADYDGERAYPQIQSLFRDSLYKQAQVAAETFLQKYPLSIFKGNADYLLAELLFIQHKYEEARARYAEFITEHPSDWRCSTAAFRIGECSLRLGRNQEAVEAFKRVLDEYPGMDIAGEAAFWIGESYARKEDLENAVKFYGLAYEGYPYSTVRDYSLYSLAWSYQRKRQFPTAIKYYELLAKEYPTSPLTGASLIRAGECYFYAKEYPAAITKLAASRPQLKTPQERGEADYLIAESNFLLGEYQKARTLYEYFLHSYESHPLKREVLYALGCTYEKLGLPDSAAAIFIGLEQGSDGLARAARYHGASALNAGGKKDEALKRFQQIYTEVPGDEYTSRALYDAGMIMLSERNLPEARNRFERICGDFPLSVFNPPAQRRLGEILYEQGKPREALAHFDTAAAGASEFALKTGAMFEGALAAYKAAEQTGASDRFSSFITAYPQHPDAAEAHFWLAELHYGAGEYDAAFEQYGLAAVNTARGEEIQYGKAWTFLKRADYENALQAFEGVIASYPQGRFTFDARIRIADCYYMLRDFQHALEAYRMVPRQFSQTDSVDYAEYQIAASEYHTGHTDLALAAFEKLKTGHPQSPLAPYAQYAIAWIWHQSEDYASAKKEFDRILERYPNSALVPFAHCAAGGCELAQKRYDGARASFTVVIEQFPDSRALPAALRGLMRCLYEEGRGAEAASVIERFLNEHPASPFAEQVKRNSDSTSVAPGTRFVIRGFELADPLNADIAGIAEKKTIPLPEHLYTERAADVQTGERDRNTAILSAPAKLRKEEGSIQGAEGLFRATVLTHLTAEIDFSFGRNETEYDYLVSAAYRRTGGFGGNTNGTGGAISGSGGLRIPSSSQYFNNARIDGAVSYAAEEYRWYGTSAPWNQRALSTLRASVGLHSAITSPMAYRGEFELFRHGIQDSSSTADETGFALDAGAEWGTYGIPLGTDVRLLHASHDVIGGGGGLTLFSITLRSLSYRWDKLSVSGGLTTFAASGMAGQSLFKLYPTVILRYAFDKRQNAFLTYHGEVEESTLGGEISRFSFLSGQAVVRFPDKPVDVTAGLESQLTDYLRTKGGFRLRYYNELGAYGDTSAPGAGFFWHGRNARIASFWAETFAKLGVNDYFSICITFRNSSTSSTRKAIPYVAGFQAGAVYEHRFPFGVRVQAQFDIQTNRTTDPSGSVSLPDQILAAVTAEYSVLSWLNASVEIRNAFDSHYELWSGIPAPPLRIGCGISACW